MENTSSLSNRSKYEVFLSFRGEDTRKNFVDHLYAALARNEITTFKDDEEVSRFNLYANLLKENAIKESRYSIVVFSKNYASSSWCLDELVKIMECSKTRGQLVLPVFYYDFSPSNLRRQGPVFGELFAKSEMKKVRAWTSALVEAANLNGVGLTDYRYQAKRIEEIVDMVSSKLNINKLNHHQNFMGKKHDTLGDTNSSHEQLVGIDRRAQQVKHLLQVKTVKTASNPVLASPSPRRTYDVFMSFKADDTCKDFAHQLHRALQQHSIHALINDQALVRPESTNPHLLTAIEESPIAIVVLSQNYASSSCCLDELVNILSCNERFGQMVLPIFYNVDSSDVRYQKGLFGEAFLRNKPGKMDIWRKALVKACTLAGWYLNCTPKSDEAPVMESIVDVISRRLDRSPLSVNNSLIGMEPRVKHVISLLKLESGGVHMLGIVGMGGIGKTTIARAVFGQVSACFDGSCFVEDIREVSKSHGLKHIQREMLSSLLEDENLHVRSTYEGVDLIRHRLGRRKVLLVLDDVDGLRQLEALAGSGKWFGKGSRIIVTTRDEYPLVAHNIMQTYYVKPLDDEESYRLLRRHAFKKDDSTKAYEDLFPQVVSYAAGLPLALKVLGSLLCGRSKKEWKSTLERLKEVPEKAIIDRLKISYDGLNDDEKEIFLDIACFYIDKEKDYAVNILDSSGFFGDTGIRTLAQKSLMSILKGHIKMHKLIVQMGWDIVRQMHPNEPGKRSRVWLGDEFYDILMDSKSMKEVDAIVVDDMHDYDYDVVDVTKAFRNMKKLRVLQIHSQKKLRFLERSRYLPKDLRWLTLERYPLPSLPTSFKGNKLVGLELLGSSISEPWHGEKLLPKLRFLKLSYSRKLIMTPDFTGTPSLEKLILEHCTSLIEVHESIGYLDRLSLVSFRSCKKLELLPQSFGKLESLALLDVSGCSNLRLPRLMDYPLQFHSDIRVIKAPVPIKFLSNLVELDLRNLSLPIFHSLDLRHLPYTLERIMRPSSKKPQEMVVCV